MLDSVSMNEILNETQAQVPQTNRTNVILLTFFYRELRKILVDRDMSFNEWLNIKIRDEVNAHKLGVTLK